MPILFDGSLLFASGPHRMDVPARALVTIPRLSTGQLQPGSIVVGRAELTVLVTGRLTAPDDADLLSQLDIIAQFITEPPTIGKLEDDAASYSDMAFIRFEPTTPPARGRLLTLPFTARFVRLI